MKSFDELKALIEQRGVHAVFGAPGEGYAIEQNADELAQFVIVAQELGVQSVLEIGTGYRAGLARFMHDEMGWQVVSVDIHDYGHTFGGITFVQSDGVELPVFDQRFDLVIIDAEHTYEAVKFDHAYYGKYADKLIMFHDIAGLRDCEGAQRYWNGISRLDPDDPLNPGCHEIIADTPERSGIGYIVLSEVSADEPIATWKGLGGEIRQGFVPARIKQSGVLDNLDYTPVGDVKVTVKKKPAAKRTKRAAK